MPKSFRLRRIWQAAQRRFRREPLEQDDLLSLIEHTRNPEKAAQLLIKHQESFTPKQIERLLRQRPEIGEHLLDIPEISYVLAMTSGNLFNLSPERQLEILKRASGTPSFKELVFARNHLGRTILFSIAQDTYTDYSEHISLIKKNLSPEELKELVLAQDDKGRTWIHMIWRLSPPLLELVEQHPQIFLTQDESGRTPLHYDPHYWKSRIHLVPPEALKILDNGGNSFLDYHPHLNWDIVRSLMVTPEHQEAMLDLLVLTNEDREISLLYKLIDDGASLREFKTFAYTTVPYAHPFWKKAVPELVKVALAHPSFYPELKPIINLKIRDGNFEQAVVAVLSSPLLPRLFLSRESVELADKWAKTYLTPEERERIFLQPEVLGEALYEGYVFEDILEKAAVEDPLLIEKAVNNSQSFRALASLMEKRLPPEKIKELINYHHLHDAMHSDADVAFLEFAERYLTPEEMLQLFKDMHNADLDLIGIKVNREVLSSYIRKLAFSLATNMPEEDRYTLAYILGFVAADDRYDVIDYLFPQMLERIDWRASNWKDALFVPVFGPTLGKIFSHKKVLGKRGQWSRGKLSLLANVIIDSDREDFPLLVAKLEELLAKGHSAKHAYNVLNAYYLRSYSSWRKYILKHAHQENMLEKATTDYLAERLNIPVSQAQGIISHIPDYLFQDVMDWIGVFDEFPEYLPLFEHFFSLSPDEYKKERYKGFDVPQKLKEAWLKDYQQQITYLPGSDSYSGEQLSQAIQDFNNHLKEKGWQGPWLEPSLLEGEPFTNLRKFEEEILQKAPIAFHPMIKQDLQRIRSLLSTGEIPPNLTFLITDSLELLFRMGKGPRISSCQAPNYSGYHKIGLLGAITNPWIKMATLVDEKGQIIGRAKLFLLKRRDGYYVMVDLYYGYDETKGLLVKHLTDVLEEWKAQGLIKDYDLFDSGEGEPAGPFRAPIYTDLGINSRAGVIRPQSEIW